MKRWRGIVPLTDRRGLTLVEMMVAIAMFGVAMSVIFGFLTRSRRSYTDMSARVEYQQNVRGVLGLVSREVRSAGCDPTDAGFNTFPLADATSFQCRMDLDGDGVIEAVEPAEDVSYTYVPENRELLRDSGSGAQVILRNVTAVDFRYFDVAGVELARPLSAADRARIRFVEISLSGESEQEEPLTYVTRVFVRNG